jgi:hypothetical protein
MPEADRIRIGDSATPSVPINWLTERGYDAASFGTDGFGAHQGIVFSRSFADGRQANEMAFVGDTLVWDGEVVVIERAP